MANSEPIPPSWTTNLYDVNTADRASLLVDRSYKEIGDVQQIGAFMAALGPLRAAEQALSDASLKYMKLNQSDMRAFQYLIVAANTGEIVTP